MSKKNSVPKLRVSDIGFVVVAFIALNIQFSQFMIKLKNLKLVPGANLLRSRC